MRRHMLMGIALLVGQCALPASLGAATQAEIDVARIKGLHWLFVNQRQNGSWRSADGMEFAATAEALEAIRHSGLRNPPYNRGVSWLANAQAPSVDSLARAIQALWPAGIRGPGLPQALLSRKNHATRAAWGAYHGYMTSFPDTPLGLAALRVSGHVYPNQQTELKNAVYCDILPAQKADGGWSYTPARANMPDGMGSGAILPTAYVLLELAAIRQATGWDKNSVSGCVAAAVNGNSIQTAIDQGLAWLLSKRNLADGGFGDEGDILETALAYQVLRLFQPGAEATGAALEHLLARQNPVDGSWGAEAMQTALVLKLLPPPASPLLDGDGDGIPDAVEALMGTNPGVADARRLATGNGAGMLVLHAQYGLDARIPLGKPYVHDLNARGGQPPHTWKIHSGALPPGLAFDAARGRISGTPSSLGDYAFAYAVADASGETANVYGRLRVVPPPPPGDFNGDGLVDGLDHAVIVRIIGSILLNE